MKKIVAILAMIAFVGGAAFAEISVSGAVIGTFNLLEGKSGKWVPDSKDPTKFNDADVNTSAEMNRIRLEASGSNEEGTFGGWFRHDGGPFGYAWWKPIEQLQVRIGSNGYDGFNSKDGVTRWMFYQTPTDTGVTFGGDNAWGGSIYGLGVNFGGAFFDGYGGTNSLMIEIKPIEVFGINLAVPFANGKIDDAYKNIIIQLDFNLAFGNIALTFVGNQGKFGYSEDFEKFLKTDTDDFDAEELLEYYAEMAEYMANPSSVYDSSGSKIYAYFGMPINDQISFDLGVGYTLPVSGEKDSPFEGMTYNAPIGIGAGFKFASDSFGLKARVGAFLGGNYTPDKGDAVEVPLKLLFDIMPFFPIGDNATLFIAAGIGMQEAKTADKHGSKADAVFGWHFNPFIQIGEEWGPKFLAGIKVSSNGDKDRKDATYINWAIPIAINVGF